MKHVFTKRCGCGAILAMREGCARCAAAERSRLHAQGVAGVEPLPRVYLRELKERALNKTSRDANEVDFTVYKGL